MMRVCLFILVLLCPPAVGQEARIITLGGDVTEIVCALGACDSIVGRDTTSESPPDVLRVPDVGYLRLLNAEGLLSLRPSLIIASDQASPSVVLQQARSAGITIAGVTAHPSPEAVRQKIRQVADALHLPAEAAKLTAQYNRELAAVSAAPLPVNVLFLLSHSGTAPLAAGEKTAADSIIRAAGGRNAAAGFARYRPLSAEGMIAAHPDLLVITRHGLATLGSTDPLWQLPGISETPAGKHRRVLIVNDIDFLSFGLQTPAAMQQLRRAMEDIPVL